MADRKSAPAGTSGSAPQSMSLDAVKAVRTLACSLTRTNKDGEADGTCEGRTKEDVRALLVGLSTAWDDKSPTKGQLDGMVTHVLKHVNAQLMSAEQPQAGTAETAAAAPPAEKSGPLYQWGTPSNVSEARTADRSTTAKLTSKKTCSYPPCPTLAPHSANRSAAHPHLLLGGSKEACLFFSRTPMPAVMGALEESIKARLAERVGEAREPLELKLEELQGFIDTGAELLGALCASSKARRRAPSRDRHLPSSHPPPPTPLPPVAPSSPCRRSLPTRRSPSRTGATVPRRPRLR